VGRLSPALAGRADINRQEESGYRTQVFHLQRSMPEWYTPSVPQDRLMSRNNSSAPPAGVVALGGVVYAEGNALGAEINSISQGTCK
jgi:hypothetical protein